MDVALSDDTRLSSRDILRLYGDSNANVTVVGVMNLKNRVAYGYETIALLKNPALNITKVGRTAFTYVWRDAMGMHNSIKDEYLARMLTW